MVEAKYNTVASIYKIREKNNEENCGENKLVL